MGQYDRVMLLSDKKSPSLVLSGGGVKAAAFHAGVCLGLQEKGFRFAGGDKKTVEEHFSESSMTFKTYVGSSAGSIICSLLAAGYSVHSIINSLTPDLGVSSPYKVKDDGAFLKPLGYRDIFSINLKAKKYGLLTGFSKKRPIINGGIEVFLKKGFKVNGLFTTENLEKYLREQVLRENKFNELGVSLYVIATQLNHSKKVVFGALEEKSTDESVKYVNYASISQACAASASLPPAFAPYGITNHKGREVFFFDGEIRDTLSTHVASDHNADLVIASYSIQPYHYNDEIGSLHEYGIPIVINQAIYQAIQQKIERHREYKREIKDLIKATEGYIKQTDMKPEHQKKLLEILISKTRYKPHVEYIYIHPSPHDYEMFFADHFSLNPKILSKIIKAGFKASMSALREYN